METLSSPLESEHREAGAKFAEFGGWSMPLEYAGGGVLAEHAAVREAVGVFDVSHLGKATVTGPGAAAFVNRCLTNDLERISAGQAQYTLLCAADGGVIDDLIAYRLSDDEILLMPNAANHAAVLEALGSVLPQDLTLTDRHTDLAVLAVQGPRSEETLAAAGLPVGHDYMSFVITEQDGAGITVCRTGYTGEHGYELLVPSSRAGELWRRLVTAGEPFGIRPAGLGARDTLRTEMGYPLHGQDISSSITPVQARLGWAVGWKKAEFFGADALRAEKERGPSRVLRGLRATGRGIPRPGMHVVDDDGAEIGTVTSGTFSPTLKTGIGLALVNASVAEGDEVSVAVRNRTERFGVVKPPFVEAGTR